MQKESEIVVLLKTILTNSTGRSPGFAAKSVETVRFPLKLYNATRRIGVRCECTVVPDGRFLEYRADIELFQIDKQERIVSYKEFKGKKSFVDEVDAKLEACNLALHWLLCTYPLQRAHERNGRGLPVDFFVSTGGGLVPFNEEYLSDEEEAEWCITQWRSMQGTQA